MAQSLRQTQDQVDRFIDRVWPKLVSRQENYRANRGRYWQGLETHSTPPAHSQNSDGSAPADRLAANPSDEFENWLVAFPDWLGTLMDASLRIDVYGGPQGVGWVLVVTFKYEGDTYRKSVNVGPETYRNHGWLKIQPPPL